MARPTGGDAQSQKPGSSANSRRDERAFVQRGGILQIVAFRDLLRESARRFQRQRDDFRRVRGPAAGAVFDLLAAAEAVGDHERVGRRGPDAWQQSLLCDLKRDRWCSIS